MAKFELVNLGPAILTNVKVLTVRRPSFSFENRNTALNATFGNVNVHSLDKIIYIAEVCEVGSEAEHSTLVVHPRKRERQSIQLHETGSLELRFRLVRIDDSFPCVVLVEIAGVGFTRDSMAEEISQG